jgi:hypothetical protein
LKAMADLLPGLFRINLLVCFGLIHIEHGNLILIS